MTAPQPRPAFIPLHGRLGRDASRPLVLAIAGFMPQVDSLGFIAPALPEADVLTAHLPGMHSPALEPNDPATAGAAFADSLRAVGEGRRVVVLASSAATPVALHLCGRAAPHALVLIEPFLQPPKVWALMEFFRRTLAPDHGLAPMAEAYLGLYSGEKDYRPLQRLAPARTWVLAGGVPLEPPRAMAGFPSFVSEAERESWRAAGAQVRICPGVGHKIAETPEVVIQALRDAIAAGEG
jgi:hypothetical protein